MLLNTFSEVHMTLANTAAPHSGQTAKLAYSLKETAQALGVSHSTVRRMVAEGELSSVRTGARVLIPVESVRNFLQTGAK